MQVSRHVLETLHETMLLVESIRSEFRFSTELNYLGHMVSLVGPRLNPERFPRGWIGIRLRQLRNGLRRQDSVI